VGGNGNLSRLEYALIVRRRVKEQLKRLNLLEFQATQFSYLDNDSLEEHFVSLPEQSGGALISEEPLPAGHVYTVSNNQNTRVGTYKLEVQVVPGTGKLIRSGAAAESAAKDAVTVAFNYFSANAHRVSTAISVNSHDYQISISDLQGAGTPQHTALALLVALFGASLERRAPSQFAVLGDITLGGTVNPVVGFASHLQVAFDAGVKRILIPMANAVDLATVPPELFTKFQTSFFSDPIDAIVKAFVQS
jgi:ATP-dependent Lon protease